MHNIDKLILLCSNKKKGYQNADISLIEDHVDIPKTKKHIPYKG